MGFVLNPVIADPARNVTGTVYMAFDGGVLSGCFDGRNHNEVADALERIVTVLRAGSGSVGRVDFQELCELVNPAPSADPADHRNTACYLENPTESSCALCIAKGFCDVRKGSVPSGCCRECGTELDCDEYITCPHCAGDVVRHSYFDEESCRGSDE
jgi:hypothetical protein